MLTNGQQIFLPLKGKELVETPDWTYALRADFNPFDKLHFGLQGKYVSERFSTDLNDETTPAYTVVDFDASYSFKFGDTQSLELQFTMSNLFDEEYYGNISSGVGGVAGQPICYNGTTGANVACAAGSVGSVGFFSIGAPRTALASIKFNF